MQRFRLTAPPVLRLATMAHRVSSRPFGRKIKTISLPRTAVPWSYNAWKSRRKRRRPSVAGELHNQAFSPLCAPAAEHLASADRSHPNAKTMRPLPAPVMGLVSPLQITPPARLGGYPPLSSTDGHHRPRELNLSRYRGKGLVGPPIPGRQESLPTRRSDFSPRRNPPSHRNYHKNQTVTLSLSPSQNPVAPSRIRVLGCRRPGGLFGCS